MTRNQIASLLTKREKGKSQIKIGDAREFLRLLVELDAELVAQGEKGPLQFLEDESDEKVAEIRIRGEAFDPPPATVKTAKKKKAKKKKKN